MGRETKLMLRQQTRQDALGFEGQASYDLDEIRAEFRKRIYSREGLRLVKEAKDKSKKHG